MDLGLPSINISFKEQGTTAVQRGQRGVVALILKDESALTPFEVTTPSDIPEELSEFNQDQIELTSIGYRTPPRKIIGVVASGEGYKDAQKYLEGVNFDYVAVPEIESNEVDNFASWIKSLREDKGKKVKAVLPNCDADHEGIINFTTSEIQIDGAPLVGGVEPTNDGAVIELREYTTAEYCGRIAGLIAGTPLTIASTFAPLPEVLDVKSLTRDELDKAIENGEFVIFNDGEKVKVARGVNSLVTIGGDKRESFKKIKIVEAMDLMHDDIKRTAEDNYLGKFSNSYDNKCLLLVAIQGYLEGLELDGVLETGSSDVFINIDQQTSYLKSIGVDTENMNEQEIKSANTRDKVFLAATINILDAIEDIELDITI